VRALSRAPAGNPALIAPADAKKRPAPAQKPLDTAEQVGNKPYGTKNERSFPEGKSAMLALAIDLLFAIAALAAVLTLADTALKARRAYAGLMRERALMEAGFAMPARPRAARPRAAGRRMPAAMPARRSPLLRPQPVLARGAA
jgi:hypothetical protein